MNEKKYTVRAPMGSEILPKQPMTEQELRDYTMQIMANEEQFDVWKEKIEKDDVSEVIEYLGRAGYVVKEM